MQAEEGKRDSQLEKDNSHLEKQLAEAELEKGVLKKLVEKTSESGTAAHGYRVITRHAPCMRVVCLHGGEPTEHHPSSKQNCQN
jgi:hypothetical protein